MALVNSAPPRHQSRILSRVEGFLAAACILASAALPLRAQSTAPEFNAERARLLGEADKYSAQGPFKPTWESLEDYKVPDWYQDAKFGIFIHWGVYSVPAFGSEWYPREMYTQGTKEYKHQLETYGPETEHGYKDFIPQFKAASFDAASWAQLFHDSGAKYVVPVAEHHDGFAMYDTGVSQYSAKKMGPHRDIIGELEHSVRAQGLHFGVSSHRAEHYWFYGNGFKFPSDVQSQQFADLYGYPLPAGEVHNDDTEKDTSHPPKIYLDDWLARDTELVEKYKPEIVYFDWWIKHPDYMPYLKRFASFYYNYAAAHGSTAVINYKNGAYPDKAAVYDIERGQLGETRPLKWQTDTSISNASWGYIEHDTFKTPEFIVQQLVDIVSKNGNLLLNIGPRSDGTIPDEVKHTLLGVGDWLKINGDAIYGTRPWTIYGEGPTKIKAGSFNDTAINSFTAEDIRFTTKAGNLYAIAMKRPLYGEIVIHSLAPSTPGNTRQIAEVSLLGSDATLQWRLSPDGLHISLPATTPEEFAYTFRIDFAK